MPKSNQKAAKNAPTQSELAAVVNRIIREGEGLGMHGDPEAAHSDEDHLHRQIIEAFCPEWVVAEVRRLADADFPRWCA